MADVFTKAKRSAVMSRIRSRGNRDTELALARLLRANGLTGLRRHVKITVEGCWLRVERRKLRRPQRSTLRPQLAVRPDFVFRRLRTAVFVDGCFWHGCPRHATWPANRAAWWRRKIEGNQARDRRVDRALRANGWRVVRVWEHALARRNARRLAARLRRLLRGPARGVHAASTCPASVVPEAA